MNRLFLYTLEFIYRDCFSYVDRSELNMLLQSLEWPFSTEEPKILLKMTSIEAVKLHAA